MQQRQCPVCTATLPRRFCRRDGVEYVRCGQCASVYHASEPDWAQIERIYQDEYHKARGHAGNPAIEAAKRETMLRYLKLLNRFLPAVRSDESGSKSESGRKLLEVGCSTGVGLAAAAESGWDAEGVEISVEAAQIARSKTGIRRVHAGRLTDANLPDGSFDAVVLFDVIEHIDPPQPTIHEIFRVLRPNGVLLMVTPDAGSLSARLLSARWPHLFVEHVTLFSRRGMHELLGRTGFRVERIGFAWKWINLEMLARHATIHCHVMFGRTLRLLDRVLPQPVLRSMFRFNIGEFYVVARRPA